jgi:hypothetical protein
MTATGTGQELPAPTLVVQEREEPPIIQTPALPLLSLIHDWSGHAARFARFDSRSLPVGQKYVCAEPALEDEFADVFYGTLQPGQGMYSQRGNQSQPFLTALCRPEIR